MRFRTIFGLALCSVNLIAFSQVPQVDFAIQIEQVPASPYFEGQQFSRRVTISNRSPVFGTFAEYFFIQPTPPNVPPFDTAIIEGDTQNCEADGQIVFTPFLAAGRSVTCIETVRALVSVGVPRRIRYRVRSSALDNIDPDLSNNEAQVEYRVLKVPTQVPMSPAAYLSMGVLLLAVGAIAARRWS
jgi:hypothetical protein